MNEILDAIYKERAYQDSKWCTIDQNPHTVAEWLLIMEGELEEAKQAWRKGVDDTDALREILQVIAVGIACLEQHGVGDVSDNIILFDNIQTSPGRIYRCGEYHDLKYNASRKQFIVSGIGGKELFASASRTAVLAFLRKLDEMTEPEYHVATGY